MSENDTDHHTLLNAKQAAKLTGLSRPTLDRWTAQGSFPKPDIKYGTARNSPTRWRLSTVKDWIAEQERATPAA